MNALDYELLKNKLDTKIIESIECIYSLVDKQSNLPGPWANTECMDAFNTLIEFISSTTIIKPSIKVNKATETPDLEKWERPKKKKTFKKKEKEKEKNKMDIDIEDGPSSSSHPNEKLEKPIPKFKKLTKDGVYIERPINIKSVAIKKDANPYKKEKNNHNYIWPSSRTFWLRSMNECPTSLNYSMVIDQLNAMGYTVENWIPLKGGGGGIKVSFWKRIILPDSIIIGNNTWNTWSIASAKPALVISRLNREFRQSDLRTEKIKESLYLLGLKYTDIEVQNLHRYIGKKKVDSSSLKIIGLDENVVEYLSRRSWISVDHKVFPVRKFIYK